MTDREERQHVIEVLKQMRLDYEDFWEENDTEEIKAFNYAIASIETDLKYDLLYEETSGQADKPTTKNEAKYCDRNICLKNEYNNVGCEDCEVTKSQEITTKNDKEQEDITWIVGNDNVQIAVRNMPVDMMQKICAIIGNKQEVSTKKDLAVDAISRAEVLKLMQDNWHTHNGDWAMQESMDDIRALPSVTPIRPKGHWIVAKGNYLGRRNACCSNCKDFYTNDWNVMDYCPHCGAKMVEPQESEG